MFQFCPSCGGKNIQSEKNRFHCPDCEFVFFQNTAAATGCVIQAGEKVLLLVRRNEPGAGKLDLPGGFVESGEGALDGLRRELREELGWEPPIPPGKTAADVYRFFASFPNIYPYKGIIYNTCDLYFTVFAPGLTEKDLNPEAGEISGLRFLHPREISLDELAFDSTRRAMEAFIDLP